MTTGGCFILDEARRRGYVNILGVWDRSELYARLFWTLFLPEASQSCNVKLRPTSETLNKHHYSNDLNCNLHTAGISSD